jgi:hypothetical protein
METNDIIELIMNKKHQLEIESLKAAHVLEMKMDIENMIYNDFIFEHGNFDDEREEFASCYYGWHKEEHEMVDDCLEYSKKVFKNESFSKVFSDMLLYYWQEFILHKEENGENPYYNEETEFDVT